MLKDKISVSSAPYLLIFSRMKTLIHNETCSFRFPSSLPKIGLIQIIRNRANNLQFRQDPSDV